MLRVCMGLQHKLVGPPHSWHTAPGCRVARTRAQTMPATEAPVDFEALAAAQADMLQMLKQTAPPSAVAEQRKLSSQLKVQEAKLTEANLSAEELAARERKQAEHAERLRQQREEKQRKEAEAEASRRLQNKNMAPGTMGIGRVAVDVGTIEAAFEYELGFGDVTLYVPLPEGVKAKQLAVDVRPRTVAVGLKGRPPYLQGKFYGTVCDDDAVWTLEGSMLKLELTKAAASTKDHWPGAVQLPEGWACQW